VRGVVLLLAAGEGTRLGTSGPKAFVDVAGVPMLKRAADAARAAELVDGLVVAVPDAAVDRARGVLDDRATIVAGGPTRQASAWRALRAAPVCDAVLVHDAARALCPSILFDLCLRALDDHEAVCTVVPVWDTLKEVSDGFITRTVDRSDLAAAQTPQGFRTALYRRAHEEAIRDDVLATDDVALVERLGVKVGTVVGSAMNIKITTRADLDHAERLLA
jgi:2-C-methyl-D-erythritol 4-phosphate cytidylyltransferase